MNPSETPTLVKGSSHQNGRFEQNVIVMRHGDRMDNAEPLWASTAARPWDPPLVEAGLARAFCTGRNLRKRFHPDAPIRRTFVSPFLRCVQTASEAISAICAVDDDPLLTTSDGVSIDSSNIKVSIEYGLCEMMNSVAIRLPPKDGNWSINIPELESILPAGTLDHTVEPIYKQLPDWEESLSGARSRYKQVVVALADKFPQENLLLVTHGEGVGAAFSAFLKDVTVYDVNYCAYVHLKRTVTLGENNCVTFGNFEVVTEHHTGISYCPSSEVVE